MSDDAFTTGYNHRSALHPASIVSPILLVCLGKSMILNRPTRHDCAFATMVAVSTCWISFTAQAQTPALQPPALAPSLASAQRQEPLTTEQSLAAFALADGFSIGLAASEPQVIDPITIRFDHLGRMWVVEMNDYPKPLPDQPLRGRIKILEDNDHDGFFEKVTLFADQLAFPTGLQPFRDGVIVTLAGEVAYMADQDGDGVCDHKEVWFTGFSKDNEQLRANHPVWTLENQVHVASGLRGGELQSMHTRWPASEKTLSLAARDFEFSPYGGDWRAVAGNSQYGFYEDAGGRRFVCSNRNPCDLLLAEAEQVANNALLPLSQWTHNVMPSAEASQVFPLVNAWTTSNLHAGTFTAACGVFRYESDLLGDRIGGDFLACEPTGSLVQRYRTLDMRIVPDVVRAHEQSEFLASRDPWFRPVDLIDGPDGALYVVDMHRAVIEHPDWMPKELQQRSDMRWGDQAGRIYRVVPINKSLHRNNACNFAASTPIDWVTQLSSANRWTRTVAARLISQHLHTLNATSDDERSAEEQRATIDSLRRILRDGANVDASTSTEVNEFSVMHSLWLLESAKALQFDDLRFAASHAHADVRRQAVRLLQRHRKEWPQADECMLWLAGDPVAVVRFQWLLEFAAELTSDELEPLLLAASLPTATNADDDSDRHWLSQALSLVNHPVVPAFLQRMLANESSDHEVLAPLIQRMGWSDEGETLRVLLEDSPNEQVLDAQLHAYAQGMLLRARSWDQVTASFSEPLRNKLNAMIANDLRIAADVNAAAAERLAAFRRAGMRRSAETEQLCRRVLDSADAELYRESLLLARRMNLEGIEDALVAKACELPPALAAATIQTISEHAPWSHALVTAIESGAMPLGMVDPASLGRLQRHPDSKLAARITQAMASRYTEDAAQALTRYQDALQGEPNLANGNKAFTTHCASCHRIRDTGFAVGPDISDMRTQTPQQILVAILDPNAAIDASYFRYSILTVDGQVLEGLLEDSSDASATLVMQESKRRTLARDQIEALRATGKSMMPEGFENQLSPRDMCDLIGYLKQWRMMPSPPPHLGSDFTADEQDAPANSHSIEAPLKVRVCH